MQELQIGNKVYLASFYHRDFRALAYVRISGRRGGKYYDFKVIDVLYDIIYDLTPELLPTVRFSSDNFFDERSLGKMKSWKKKKMIKAFFTHPHYIGGIL